MLAKDLEELEGTKASKYCDACTYKEYAINGEWCYMFETAPTKKCYQFKMRQSLKEALEIQGLINKFPNLEK